MKRRQKPVQAAKQHFYRTFERNAVEGVSRVLQSAQPYYPQRKEVRQDKPEVPEKDVRYKVNADDQRRSERSVQARLHRTH